jgi:hypothetical protein
MFVETYIKDKKLRDALHISADFLNRLPEVQHRLRSRKIGVILNADDINAFSNLVENFIKN